MKIAYDKDIDSQNIVDYARPHSDSIDSFRCVLCGRHVSISDSFSSKGKRLTCSACMAELHSKGVSYKVWPWEYSEDDDEA